MHLLCQLLLDCYWKCFWLYVQYKEYRGALKEVLHEEKSIGEMRKQQNTCASRLTKLKKQVCMLLAVLAYCLSSAYWSGWPAAYRLSFILLCFLFVCCLSACFFLSLPACLPIWVVLFSVHLIPVLFC